MADSPSSNRPLRVLLACTALCYAIGYPLALIGHSNVGWVFVTLGGPLLIALGVAIVRRVHLGDRAPKARDSAGGIPDV